MVQVFSWRCHCSSLCYAYTEQSILFSQVLSVYLAAAAIYALASVARWARQKLEELLVKKWGGMPTTIALRHRDNFLDSVQQTEVPLCDHN